MDDNNQVLDQASADGNVMERVLNAFDGLYDNATTFISGAAASAGEIGSNLGGNAGDIAGSLGEKAGDLGRRPAASRPGSAPPSATSSTRRDLRQGPSRRLSRIVPPERPA